MLNYQIKKINKTFLKTNQKIFFSSLLINKADVLSRDSKLRNFISKLSENSESSFTAELSTDEKQFVDLLYNSFFDKMTIEESQLFNIKKLLNEIEKEDKGFIYSKFE
jgi:predicted metalloendopeptidase